MVSCHYPLTIHHKWTAPVALEAGDLLRVSGVGLSNVGVGVSAPASGRVHGVDDLDLGDRNSSPDFGATSTA